MFKLYYTGFKVVFNTVILYIFQIKMCFYDITILFPYHVKAVVMLLLCNDFLLSMKTVKYKKVVKIKWYTAFPAYLQCQAMPT